MMLQKKRKNLFDDTIIKITNNGSHQFKWAKCPFYGRVFYRQMEKRQNKTNKWKQQQNHSSCKELEAMLVRGCFNSGRLGKPLESEEPCVYVFFKDGQKSSGGWKDWSPRLLLQDTAAQA